MVWFGLVIAESFCVRNEMEPENLVSIYRSIDTYTVLCAVPFYSRRL